MANSIIVRAVDKNNIVREIRAVGNADGSYGLALAALPNTGILGQIADDGNSMVVTSASASPGNPWVGAWYETRSAGIVRQLTTLVSAVASGLGGTFTFEYGNDGLTAIISEALTIDDFATVRDFDLVNAGNYYRVKFAPDRVLVGSESVIITTIQRTQYDGPFVRLGNQEIEVQNAAMPQTFAYLKGFRDSGKSGNIGITDDDELLVSSSASNQNVRALLSRENISSTAYGILADLSDTTNFPHVSTGRIDISLLKVVIDPASNSVGSLDVGVITRIDGTDADMVFAAHIPFGKSPERILSINNYSPSQMKLGVTGGVWLQGVSNVSAANVAAVNTGITLDSPIGTSTVTPAVGDVIVRYFHSAGSAWDGVIAIFYHSNATAA
jgi:hypothetical protein